MGYTYHWISACGIVAPQMVEGTISPAHKRSQCNLLWRTGKPSETSLQRLEGGGPGRGREGISHGHYLKPMYYFSSLLHGLPSSVGGTFKPPEFPSCESCIFKLDLDFKPWTPPNRGLIFGKVGHRLLCVQ